VVLAQVAYSFVKVCACAAMSFLMSLIEGKVPSTDNKLEFEKWLETSLQAKLREAGHDGASLLVIMVPKIEVVTETAEGSGNGKVEEKAKGKGKAKYQPIVTDDHDEATASASGGPYGRENEYTSTLGVPHYVFGTGNADHPPPLYNPDAFFEWARASMDR
jgi:hypothetical protein